MIRNVICRLSTTLRSAGGRDQVATRPSPTRGRRLYAERLEPRVVLSVSGDVVINEIMQNPAEVADSDGEWFELFNATDKKIDIDGWAIADIGFDGHIIKNGGPLILPPGGFLVLARNGDASANGGVSADYVYGDDIVLANGADELVLFDTAGSEIDHVQWDDGVTFPDSNGASMALRDPTLDNNIGANWCPSAARFGQGDRGTPGMVNDCNTVEAGDIVINEIMQNPSVVSDSVGEWFEVVNTTDAGIDINGWTIRDDGSDSHVISKAGSLEVPAGGFLVLARNGDFSTNGGVNADYVYGNDVRLANSSDELVLVNPLGVKVDRVAWDDGATFPAPVGASMALAVPSLDNSVGGNWCVSSTPFGVGDMGTPGTVNDCDNTGPDTSHARPSVSNLGPPNHKFVTIEILGVTDPDGGPVEITIVSIFQDEPVDGRGSGHTAVDGRGVGTSTAEVRAERAGGGNGRVYHIVFMAEDSRGGKSIGEILVGVPHNKKRTPVDDGALFDSTVPHALLPRSQGHARR